MFKAQSNPTNKWMGSLFYDYTKLKRIEGLYAMLEHIKFREILEIPKNSAIFKFFFANRNAYLADDVKQFTHYERELGDL